MIIAILIALIILVFGIICAISERSFCFAIVGLFASTMVFMVCALISYYIGSELPEEENVMQVISSKNIVALKDNSYGKGRIFLGSGTINDELYYTYLVDEDHGIKPDTVRASDAFIVISDGTPRIEFVSSVGFKKKSRYIYATPSKGYWIFYIPEGSVDYTYNIDLE